MLSVAFAPSTGKVSRSFSVGTGPNTVIFTPRPAPDSTPSDAILDQLGAAICDQDNSIITE